MLSQGRGNMVLVGSTRNYILHGSVEFQFSVIMQVWDTVTYKIFHKIEQNY